MADVYTKNGRKYTWVADDSGLSNGTVCMDITNGTKFPYALPTNPDNCSAQYLSTTQAAAGFNSWLGGALTSLFGKPTPPPDPTSTKLPSAGLSTKDLLIFGAIGVGVYFYLKRKK